MRITRQLATVTAVSLALLAGCSSTSDEPQEPAATTSTPAPRPSATPDLPAVRSYVAIGDSFTSGPGLAELRDDGAFCLRSDHNWPSLLARALRPASFDDVSCAGATTYDVLQPGRGAAAQIDAVRPSTDLVTVGIGGNDGNLFASLVSSCSGGGGTCRPFLRDSAPAILDETVGRIAKVLEDVRARAPKATVLLVGYPRIMPDSGTCASVGIPAADTAAVAGAEEALDRSLAAAARQVGVPYVSVRDASRGHDACAGDRAWTNGADVRDEDGIAFHPRRAGMAAVARAVQTELALGAGVGR
ncbi:SGNH/GDSL hydrolase family protein [Aeromicrobium sp. NPDC092404]|uniref:SGNH/GDSL hydrolase family protein n=1 Tax=Aeromicrobium sp. NPDC092404 TaxID=3154976 RepID=UPI00341A4D91